MYLLYSLFIKYCVFFSRDFRIFRTLVFLLVPGVYTHQAGRTPALQQNWQSIENNKILRKKNTIFNEHPVYGLGIL